MAGWPTAASVGQAVTVAQALLKRPQVRGDRDLALCFAHDVSLAVFEPRHVPGNCLSSGKYQAAPKERPRGTMVTFTRGDACSSIQLTVAWPAS